MQPTRILSKITQTNGSIYRKYNKINYFTMQSPNSFSKALFDLLAYPFPVNDVIGSDLSLVKEFLIDPSYLNEKQLNLFTEFCVWFALMFLIEL